MNALHPIFQEALTPFAPLLNKDGTAASPAMAALFNVAYTPPAPKAPTMGNWMHVAIIGEGNETVNCHFDMSEDGDVENLRVIGDVGEVTKYLHFTQIEELECECYDSYLIQVKEHNDDLKISRHLASSDDLCCGV